MENLKWVLSQVQAPSREVQQLLKCLDDPAFDLDVYICSYGGVGSTELSNFLTRHGVRCNLITDTDSVRHVNSPPARLGCRGTRVLYLFGDPLAAAASHYRRGHAHHQALKTGGDPRLPEAGFPVTFDEYVQRGEDLFGFEAHFGNWLQQPSAYDILYVRYERMWEPAAARALLAHACGPLKTPTQIEAMSDQWCASHRPRVSRVSPEQRAQMYVGLTERMDALPAVFLRRTGAAALEDLSET